MKHHVISQAEAGVVIASPSDADIEAQAFDDLATQKTAWDHELDDGVVILQHPETRALWQRVSAWWRFHYRSAPRTKTTLDQPIKEPDWHGHWRTTKYL